MVSRFHQGNVARAATLVGCFLVAQGIACVPNAAPSKNPVAYAQSLLPVYCGDVSAAERATAVLAKPAGLAVEAAVEVRSMTDGFPHGYPKGPRPAEVQGAVLRIPAERGITAAWLQRQLECHQSEVVTGRAPLVENDPFVLPNEWVDIQVRESGPALEVRTRARTRDLAEAVLERAERFQRTAVAERRIAAVNNAASAYLGDVR